MTRWTRSRTMLASFVVVASAASVRGAPVTGRIVDAATRAGVPEAVVTAGATIVRADAQGQYILDAPDSTVLLVRAPGYQRREVALSAMASSGHDIALTPFRPKALYLSVYGVGDKKLRGDALRLIGSTELNAVVIDVKGDRGIVPFRSSAVAATAPAAQRVITVPDLPALVRQLKELGIYTIARIVLFKDAALIAANPSLAIRRLDGSVFVDREGLAWANPYSREVWNYNIGIAVEAARAGFDEIQFDYTRLPDATGLAYDRPWTQPDREAAVEGFLAEARAALAPFNVFLAVDVFGYVCWNANDTRIGQNVDHLVRIVDYVSPMLYPSSFQFGIPGFRNPVEHPAEIVRLSLEHALQRTGATSVHFRPWLQAFRDYAFGGRTFAAGEIRAQIDAAERFGSDGWMLWNPQNRYSSADLRP